MDCVTLLIYGGLVLGLLKAAWEWSQMGSASSKLKDWPGPPRTFAIGNSAQLSEGPKMLRTFLSWFTKWGSPTRISFGPFHAIHIHSADHVEAMLKCTKNTNKSSDYEFVAEWLGHGLLTSNGDLWQSRRKILTPTFHFAILKDFMAVFNAQTHTLVRILKEQVQKKPKETIDIVPLVTAATLDIICETAMGTTLEAQTHDVETEYEMALRDYGLALMYRMMRPWLWHRRGFQIFSNTNYNKYYNAIQVMQAFTRKVVDERIVERASKGKRANEEASSESEHGFGKKRRRAFLDLLLDMMDQGQLDRNDVREEVDTFMFEGHDTTSHGIMWALYVIGRHPELQQRARDEIESVLGSDEDITAEHLGAVPYLDACLKESQRIWSSVPFVMRAIDKPLVLDSYHTVPPGATVYINFLQLHRDPEHWPEPLKFDPERFMPENSVGRHPFAFAPFSAGVRNCIGQKFANMEMKVTLMQLLRKFSLESVQAEADMEPAFSMVLVPTKGIHIRLTPVH